MGACEMHCSTMWSPDFPEYYGVGTIELNLDTPVVASSIFLFYSYGADNKYSVDLRDEFGNYRTLIKSQELDCADSPAELAVHYDLTDVYVTHGVRVTLQ